jgi:hypothetical protein
MTDGASIAIRRQLYYATPIEGEYTFMATLFVVIVLYAAYYQCRNWYKQANGPLCSKRFEDALAEAQARVSGSNAYDVKPVSFGDDYVSADDYMASIKGGGTVTNDTFARREEDPKPYNGQYDMSHVDTVGAVVQGSLNLHFVERSAGNGIPCSYGITGMGRRLRNNETVILDGKCNADGLAWWTERMPYDTVEKVVVDGPGRRFNEDEYHVEHVTRYMTVLSHGEFDFRKSTFQGWYYGQVRETEDFEFGCIPDCTVELRGNYLSFSRR